MQHPFDKLTLPNGGALIFTPAPGTQAVAMNEALEQLQRAGAQALLTLMPDEEMTREGVASLPEACKRIGLQWFHFPIADDTPPGEAFARAWQAQAEQVLAKLRSGETIAVHCKGGSGRTGLMIAVLLLEMGEGEADTIGEVQRYRPKALLRPDHIAYLRRHVKP